MLQIKFSTFCVFAFILGVVRGVQPSPAPAHADVIVVGAGPAGVAAATKLDAQGVDVRVFDAQDYIGGRVKSVKFGDAYVDMGAEWCHGEKDNIVFDLMKDAKILAHPNYAFRAADSDGHFIEEQLLLELDEIFEALYAADGARNSTENDTVGGYFTKAYAKAIRVKFSLDPRKYSVAKLAYRTFMRHILSSEGAFSWFDPSALSDYKDCEGDHSLTWNGLGYKTVLEKLMENFDRDRRVHLGAEVKSVAFDPKEDKVAVILSNGARHTAQHVIFTPSLGVLKRDHRTLFRPELPAEKVRAIDALGIGAVMKVMLHFADCWWTQNETFSGVSFIWTHEDRDTLAVQFDRGPRHHGLSWLTDFMGVFRVENNPKVLSCWFTGEFVPEIEALDDRTLIEGITFAVRKFLGKAYDIQAPDRIARSQWYANKFTRGTYSYQTIASRKIKPSGNVVLSQPILDNANVPRILFAGEATHPYYYSTVHGAVESGFREAERLIAIIKR